MRNVIGHECRDEVIAVIVAFVLPERDRLSGFARCSLEPVGMKLRREEVIGESLVNQDSILELCVRLFYEFSRVVMLPRFAIRSQVA